MDYTCTQTIDCKQGAIRAVRFNVDGNYCLTCGSDKRIALWNPYKSLQLKKYAGHGDEVLDAASSCDHSQIVSGGLDKTVILWDVVTAQPLRRLRGHAGKITTLVFNEESSAVISGSYDNSVMCWDVKSRQNKPVQTMKDATDCITKVKITSHEILTSSLDGKIRRYDMRVGEIIEDYIGEPVTSCTFTSDEQCILVGCSDDSLKLFDKNTGELLGEYDGHKSSGFYVECAVDKTDSYVFSGSNDGSIWCWDLVKMSILNKLNHSNNGVVHSVSTNPHKSAILSACGSTVKLWEKQDAIDVD